MKKINYIFQFISRSFLYFLICFIWLKFYLKNIWISVILALLTSFLIDLLLQILNKKHKNRDKLKLKEQEDASNMFISLATNSNGISFFQQLAKQNFDVESTDKFIIIKHNDGDVILYPFLFIKDLTPDDIIMIIKNTNNFKFKKLIICCNNISKESLTFIKQFDLKITLLDKFDTYEKLYKKYNYFPLISVKNHLEKTSFKDILAFSFNKHKTKNYICSALVILFSSIFIPRNLYYCITASILLLFALISLFNPFETKTIPTEILD